ncbi:hypothetical protein pb186bvf_014154 [Paramecium bursaria]
MKEMKTQKLGFPTKINYKKPTRYLPLFNRLIPESRSSRTTNQNFD